MGREDGFHDFATASSPALLRSAWLLCGDRQTAEDLTQDTLVKVYLVWGRRRVENPAAYAHTTLVRTWISRQRRRSSHERPVASVPERTTHDAAIDVRLDLASALALLAATDRAVLVLRFLEDRSVAETGRMLRLSDDAVRSRTKRALEQLRGRFARTRDDYLGGHG